MEVPVAARHEPRRPGDRIKRPVGARRPARPSAVGTRPVLQPDRSDDYDDPDDGADTDDDLRCGHDAAPRYRAGVEWVLAAAALAVAVLGWLFPRAPKPDGTWMLLRRGGSDTFVLTNELGQPAHDVRLDLGEYPETLTRQTGPWREIEAGDSVMFVVQFAAQVPIPTAVISWSPGRGRRRREWRRSLAAV